MEVEIIKPSVNYDLTDVTFNDAIHYLWKNSECRPLLFNEKFPLILGCNISNEYEAQRVVCELACNGSSIARRCEVVPDEDLESDGWYLRIGKFKFYTEGS